MSNHLPGRRDVTTSRSKRFGEGPHEDFDIAGVDAPMLANAATSGAQGANRVRLVHIQVELVLSLERDDTGKIANVAFHRVEAFWYKKVNTQGVRTHKYLRQRPKSWSKHGAFEDALARSPREGTALGRRCRCV